MARALRFVKCQNRACEPQAEMVGSLSRGWQLGDSSLYQTLKGQGLPVANGLIGSLQKEVRPTSKTLGWRVFCFDIDRPLRRGKQLRAAQAASLLAAAGRLV